MAARRASTPSRRLAAVGVALALFACERSPAVVSDGGGPDLRADQAVTDGPPWPMSLPWVSTYAGSGCTEEPNRDGPRLQAVLWANGAMAMAPDGRLYFADGLSGIRVVDGEYVRTTAPGVGGSRGLAFASRVSARWPGSRT